MDIHRLLRRVVDENGSDLHLRVPNRPVLRIYGNLITQTDLPPVTQEDAVRVLAELATPEQLDSFRKNKELDISYDVPGLARFRVNVLQQRGTLSIAFRMIPFEVPTIDELGLPQILKELILSPRGLILVTGPTGSGKSTTLAAMINHLNHYAQKNVITIEEPIEFVHENRKCLIAQREIGRDTESFPVALVRALRHDPDVIILGEMRDLETIRTAITAAETGHLVLGTLHTYDAAQSIDRVIDIFPPEQQQQVRIQLSQILVAVLSQTLLPRVSGGMIAAFEIMVATSAVRNLIRDKKVFQLPSVIQLASGDGMQTMDQALTDLIKCGAVTLEAAESKAMDKKQFEKWLGYTGTKGEATYRAREAHRRSTEAKVS